MKTESKNLRPGLLLLFLLFLAVLGYFIFFSPKTGKGGWHGEWSFIYYYENDTTLQYSGTILLNTVDSLSAQINVRAPRSNRVEELSVENLVISSEGLQGKIAHQLYRIKGGPLTEVFSLEISGADQFKGTGRCTEYCAEGTEDYMIIWKGQRLSE